MKVLLTRGTKEHEAHILADDAGYRVTLDGREHTVAGVIDSTMRVRIDGRPLEGWVRRQRDEIIVELKGRAFAFRVHDPRAPKLTRKKRVEDSTRGEIHAPMPGLIVEVLARVGDHVEAGSPIVVIEAMKMQNALAAPIKGRVATAPVTAGTAVDTGDLLLSITPEGG